MVKIKMILNSHAYQKELVKITAQDVWSFALKEKSILITGAAGLIGSAIVDVLMKLNERFSSNIKITCMCRNKKKAMERFEPYLKNECFTLLIRDVCEPIECEQEWNYIIHAAGNAHPLAFATEPVETMKANLLGTINLLDNIKGQKREVEKFLFISSGEVYGESREEVFCEETIGSVNTMKVRSCYPESKRAAETLCVSYGEEYGININVARLSYIYGPNFEEDNTRADVQFMKKAFRGETIIMKSDGSQLRSYCYIMDAVSGILCIMLKGENGAAYNVADDRSVVTIREFAELIAKWSGVSVVFENPQNVEKSGYSKMKREVLGVEKLKMIGWKPTTDIEKGIKNTLEVLNEKQSALKRADGSYNG